jgi:hypothetical protein
MNDEIGYLILAELKESNRLRRLQIEMTATLALHDYPIPSAIADRFYRESRPQQ